MLEKALELCKKFGISLVFVPSFPQAFSGAVGVFKNSKPLLIFSERYANEILFLEMLFEALEFFENLPQIKNKLQTFRLITDPIR